jgi:hypothetical protein
LVNLKLKLKDVASIGLDMMIMMATFDFHDRLSLHLLLLLLHLLE